MGDNHDYCGDFYLSPGNKPLPKTSIKLKDGERLSFMLLMELLGFKQSNLKEGVVLNINPGNEPFPLIVLGKSIPIPILQHTRSVFLPIHPVKLSIDLF